MVWLRKGFVHFLSVVLFICLIGVAAATGASLSLSHPDKLESWLSSSKIYDHLTGAALDQSQKSGNGSSGSVSFSDPRVRQAAETAFTPQLLRTNTNIFIDSNYSWLTGKTATPTFTIDLSEAKQNFAKLVGQYAEMHLAGLPVCSAAQLAQISIPVDPLSISCRPAPLSPQSEGARVVQEVNNSKDLLSDPVITAGSLNQDLQNSQNKPYYQRLSSAPKIYRFSLELPWILASLALLSTLGIVFIAPRRRRGVGRVGVVLLASGVVLVAAKFVADALVNKLEDKAIRISTLADQLKQPISDLLHHLELQLAQSYLWFGIAFLVIALLIFFALFKTRQSTTKQNTPGASPEDKVTIPQTSQTTSADIRLTPHRRPPTGNTGLKPMSPQPKQSNSPRPKRSRLIQ